MKDFDKIWVGVIVSAFLALLGVILTAEYSALTRVAFCSMLLLFFLLLLVVLAKSFGWDSSVSARLRPAIMISKLVKFIKRSTNLLLSEKNKFCVIAICVVGYFVGLAISNMKNDTSSHEVFLDNKRDGIMRAEIESEERSFSLSYVSVMPLTIGQEEKSIVVATFLTDDTADTDFRYYNLIVRFDRDLEIGREYIWDTDNSKERYLISVDIKNPPLEYSGSDMTADKGYYKFRITYKSPDELRYQGDISAIAQLHYGSIFTDRTVEVKNGKFDIKIDP